MGLFAKLREGLTKTRDSLMGRVDTLVKETRKIDEDFYEELEDILLMSDCGMKATTAIMDELRRRVSENKVKDADTAKQMLKDIMIEQMDIPRPPLRWPMVMLVVGVNGAGKTTTIGKLALRFQNIGRRIILCAADTFRAAAADQLTVWAERARVPIVKHAEGADPAAVVYDGIQSAKAQGADLLIAADCTAYAYGRFHQDFIRDRIVLIGCPKLDDTDYSLKLTDILAKNEIRSVTVVRMEVPCCGGISYAAEKAVARCGKKLPMQIITIGTDGEICR